jgi:uncharacterized repeat protein (TIGR02543 family)
VCALACSFIAPRTARAQSASINGALGNFDVSNNQGRDAHGFEIEFEGVHPEDVRATFNTERYGAPSVIATDTGTIVRWAAAYAGYGFTATTAPHDPAAPLAGACYQWAGPEYDASGCEHFGVTLAASAARTTYRWLVEDPYAPGALVAGEVPIAVASPGYSVDPNATAGAAPTLNADVNASSNAAYPTRYGDAVWLKVYKTQLVRAVGLDELTNDNPAVVPEDAAHVETAWTLIQADPLIVFTKGNKSRGSVRNSGPVNSDTRAVVRRYEVYEYTGIYDPVFHQVVCQNSNCSGPGAGEVGALISAQMTSADIVVPSVAVTRSGSGNVFSSDKLLSCGSTCIVAYAFGATTTLTAQPSSGYRFAGWTGACTGTSPTCSLLITEHLTAAASFTALVSSTPTAPPPPPPATTTTAPPPPPSMATTAPPPSTSTKPVSLSIGISNKGGVKSSDGALNCPGACSEKIAPGTTVTLTAVPAVAPFVSWSGACVGTQPTCTFTVTRDSQVQATFAK